jgi:hypothetical protein
MFLKPAGIVQPWGVIAGIGVHGFEQGHLVVADPDASLAHDTLPAGSTAAPRKEAISVIISKSSPRYYA